MLVLNAGHLPSHQQSTGPCRLYPHGPTRVRRSLDALAMTLRKSSTSRIGTRRTAPWSRRSLLRSDGLATRRILVAPFRPRSGSRNRSRPGTATSRRIHFRQPPFPFARGTVVQRGCIEATLDDQGFACPDGAGSLARTDGGRGDPAPFSRPRAKSGPVVAVTLSSRFGPTPEQESFSRPYAGPGNGRGRVIREDHHRALVAGHEGAHAVVGALETDAAVKCTVRPVCDAEGEWEGVGDLRLGSPSLGRAAAMLVGFAYEHVIGSADAPATADHEHHRQGPVRSQGFNGLAGR